MRRIAALQAVCRIHGPNFFCAQIRNACSKLTLEKRGDALCVPGRTGVIPYRRQTVVRAIRLLAARRTPTTSLRPTPLVRRARVPRGRDPDSTRARGGRARRD